MQFIKYWKHFPSGKVKKHFKICLFGFLALVLLAINICAYYIFVHPVFSLHFLKKDVHEGVSYYENHAYLTFESGDRFCEFVSKSVVATSAKPVYFYHIDNKVRDNPFYGKQCDVFSVDIAFSEDQFLEEKSRILGDNTEKLWEEGDLTFFVVEDKTHTNGDVLMVAFCGNATIRYMLITDVDPYEYGPGQYDKGLYFSTLVWRNSELRWSTGGQGDGSVVP